MERQEPLKLQKREFDSHLAHQRIYMQFKTKEEAEAFVRKIMGPPKRRLEGAEHDRVWLMLQMTEPVRETNNQHSCVQNTTLAE